MAAIRSSPGDSRSPGSLGVLLVPAVVTAASVAVAEFVVTPAARAPVAWCGAVAVLAVLGVGVDAVRRRRSSVAPPQDDVSSLDQAADQNAQIVLLADAVLPAAIERLRQGETVDEVLDALGKPDGLAPDFHPAHLAMLRRVLEAVKAEEDLRESAQRAFVNIARRVQAIVHRQFQDLRKMEDRHGANPQMFGDLLHLDHGTALIGRLADSIAVLGGSRPGRQWQQDVPLFSVLRGAISRISDYQRVDLHSVQEVAVVGPAVEPLIHAVAEILDNATRYSPPHTRVHLTAVEVPSGVAIEIEDGGVGLSQEARARAEQVLSQVSGGLDLAELGESPRLGLSVVGLLAQANGFQVALRPSAYGGVRAVLVIPSALVTTVPASAPETTIPGAGVVTAGRPAAARNAAEPRTAQDPRTVQDPRTGGPRQPPEYAVNGAGLPQRHRRRRVATADDPSAPPGQAAVTDGVVFQGGPVGWATEPVQPGAWLEAFQSAVSGEDSGSPGATGDEPSNSGGDQQ